jgi:hypothetical protein
VAKELATGVVLRQGQLECTTLRKGRARHTVVDSKTAEIQTKDGVPVNLPPSADSDASAISEKIRAARGKGDGPTSIALSPRHVFMRVVELPTVDGDELEGMIQLQVDKFSPFASDAVVVSHEVLSQTDSTSSVLIAVAEEKTIAAVGVVMTAARIFPQRVDIETLSWLRLLKDAKKLTGQGSELVVLQDVSDSEIIILQEGLPVAFASLGETGDMSDDDICAEIEFTLTTLEVEHGINEVQSLSLWHWGAKPRELSSALQERLGLKVKCEAFEALPSLSEGLARRYFDVKPGGVDLSLPQWHAAESGFRTRKRLIAASIAALGIWLLAILGLVGAIQYSKQQLAKLTAKEKEIEEPARRAREVRAMLRMLQLTEDRTGRPCSAIECLNKVAEVVPHAPSGQMKGIDEIRLFHYDIAKRNRVEIRGEASDPNYVYDFEKALNNSEVFTDVELRGPRQIKEGRHSFTLLLGLPSKEGEQ